MLRLRADADVDELHAVMAGLDALRAQIDGFTGFSHGPNRDMELKSSAWPHGFIADFADAAALARYAADPGHRALGARLVALCEGGGDGIMVYDLETSA
ncbi:Dabb family protein [Thalassococcus sp. CAU 1522]|uniref:Dabb family protein n=2 Tax=Thalassococcus arenae TaxID=2851652 RepID=A0ABS6N4I6_9RHOB|nr:Dabb family protein [Thalassococcus arenae]